MKRKDPKYKYEFILLLDDNELDNFINQKVIEAYYFSKNIYINTGGISALEFFKNLSVLKFDETTNIFPSLVFVDINMPMMNGFQFLDEFKILFPEKYNSVKFVILSSSIELNDKLKVKEISEDIVFLTKPLTPEMLVDL